MDKKQAKPIRDEGTDKLSDKEEEELLRHTRGGRDCKGCK